MAPSQDQGVGARGESPDISSNGTATVIARGRVDEIQRARLLAAMVEVSAEYGLADATVARIVARAGVSRRTYYELFEDREQCFLAAFDDGVARAVRCVSADYDLGAKWAQRVRSALTSLLWFLDQDRDVARLLVVGSLAAGATVLERRQRLLKEMIAVVDEGRKEVRVGSPRVELPPLTAEGVVGGAVSIVHARLASSRVYVGMRRSRNGRSPNRVSKDGSLFGLVNPLMSMIVLPYQGPTVARRELERAVPKPRPQVKHANRDPLRELEMRLTYRTVRVLMSVAANPGASNRMIGQLAGIADQGQISKLLTRLERLELVKNTGLPTSKGAPNAWTLTKHGHAIHAAIDIQGTAA